MFIEAGEDFERLLSFFFFPQAQIGIAQVEEGSGEERVRAHRFFEQINRFDILLLFEIDESQAVEVSHLSGVYAQGLSIRFFCSSVVLLLCMEFAQIVPDIRVTGSRPQSTFVGRSCEFVISLAKIEMAEFVVSDGVAGVFLHCLQQSFQGGIEFLLANEDSGQIVVGCGVIGLELDRPPVFGNRLRVGVVVVVGLGQVKVTVNRLGHQLQPGFIGADSSFVVGLLNQGQSLLEVLRRFSRAVFCWLAAADCKG